MKLEDITFLIVTYKSEKIIRKCLSDLPEVSKKIIIENSGNVKLKEELLREFKNLKVMVMDENLGYGRANNIGIKISDTNYVFILNPDTYLSSKNLEQILSYLENIEFAIAAPLEDNEIDNTNLNKKIMETETVKGFAMILNKKKFKDNFFDEKIFLYLEEIDLCKRMRSLNEKIILINVKIKHLGGNSHYDSQDIEIIKSRNWHWMWSKFYFNKKHYGYCNALIKTLPNFISSCLKFIFYKIKKNKVKKIIYEMRIKGLINSYLLKPSSYRPY